VKRGLALFCSLSALACASSASATIAFVGDLGVNHASGNSVTVTTSGFDCPSGSLLIAQVAADVDRHATDAVTTGGGDTLTRGSENFFTSPSQYGVLFYGITAHDTPIGGTVKYCAVAACTSAFTDMNVTAECFSGIASSSPLDISTTWATVGSGTSLSATATGALTQAAELIILQGGISTTGTAPACGNSATIMATSTGAPSTYTITPCYKIVAATTTQTMSFSWTTATGAQNEVMTFKGASGGGPVALPAGSLSMMGVGG
jgi:hypothetical protein